VTAQSFNSGEIHLSKDLLGVSLAAAFSNGAIPAIVAATQPNEKGGLVSVSLISVATAVGSAAP
jgi:hypothetical protein